MLRKIVYVAPAAVMAISLSGCMGIGDDTSGSGSDNGAGNVALTAAQVMNKAADNTAGADSYKMDMRVNAVTKYAGKQHAVHVSGTGQYQLKPSLAFATTFNSMSMGGQDLPGGMQLRFVDKTIYLKSALLQKLGGSSKPWIKFDVSKLGQKSGVNFDQLLKTAQDQANPVTYTKMFTTSKDVKKVGPQTVRGVQTTHYTGTVDLTKAFSKLDPKARKSAESQLKELKHVKFDLFTDDQQLPRKIVMHGNGSGTKYSTTLLYSDFGQPVHVAAPPAAQTTDGTKLHPGGTPS